MDEPAEQRAKGWDFAALVLLLFGGFVFVVGLAEGQADACCGAIGR